MLLTSIVIAKALTCGNLWVGDRHATLAMTGSLMRTRKGDIPAKAQEYPLYCAVNLGAKLCV
ncbi:MAG: hypothetical protein JM58_03280 [Peptococcaceae bacterium BICA1-8]|nr:MAG: hypothetical protein JM58_03280 [Peptococcaceae bacterium BICA1-8]